MTTFTAMTWNVENLFPPGHPISPRRRVTTEEYDAKLDYLASRILEVRPDVIGLQEVGGDNRTDTRTLHDLQGRLRGVYPHDAASSHPDGRHIRVAFLSALPISEAEDIIDFPSSELVDVPNWEGEPPIRQMGRGALVIEVEVTRALRVRLVTTHLKSKLVSYPAHGEGARFTPRDETERGRGTALALVRRSAEALAVRTRVADLMQTDAIPTIVLGDLNDGPRAATSQLLLGPEDADATSPDKLDPVRLYNLMDGVPRRGDETNDKWFLAADQRYTRVTAGRREILDQILVSRNLLGEVEDNRGDLWSVSDVRSLVDSIERESVGDNPTERVGRARPDHAPVFARFAL